MDTEEGHDREGALTSSRSAEPAPVGAPVAVIPGPYAGHLPALDGLRGLAILGVLVFHLFPGNLPGGIAGALGSIRVLGETGVDLFFVLSGFLITGILYDSAGDSGYFRKFYARRALRIFPLYYGVLAVLFLVTPRLHLEWRGMTWVLLAYLQNTDVNGPFYQFRVGAGVSLDHFWSLAVEEQFYLVWPLVVFLVPDRRRLLWVGAAMIVGAPCLRYALALHGTDLNYINRSTWCRADTLMAGAMLALALRGPKEAAVLRVAKGCFAGALAGCVLISLPVLLSAKYGSDALLVVAAPVCRALQLSVLAFAAVSLLAWCLRPGAAAQRIFAGRGWRFFGRYSYGLYVFHYVALAPSLRLFKSWTGALTANRAAAVIGAGLLSFVLATAAAILSYHLYEQRFLRLKRFFPYDGEADRAARRVDGGSA